VAGPDLRAYVREPIHRVTLRGRALRPWRVRRFRSFGEGSVIDRPAWILGPHMIDVGSGVLIMRGAWIAAEHNTWSSAKPAIVIGDRVMVRAQCTISASERILIEPDVLIAGSCTIIDSDHTHGPSPQPVDNPRVSAPIHIGRGTWLAERVTVLRGTRIGRHCTIGAGSVVKGEIPDFSIAVGSPARVVGQVDPAAPLARD
jgi:acetyltransferase-like isoleucine patch superfamily enzyme